MDKDTFKYTYSAPNEDEKHIIEEIRKKYIPLNEKERKMKEIKKLDMSVKRFPEIISIIFGVVGFMIMGIGMTMILEWNIILFGIIVSIIGVPFIALAYPLYKYTLDKNKEKYGKRIIELSDELLEEK